MNTMASVAAHVSPLPDRLMRFFVKYPPSKFSAYATGQSIPTLKQRIEIDSKPLSATYVGIPVPDTNAESSDTRTEDSTTGTSTTPQTRIRSNPFLPSKNHATGRWSGAKIGLRTQADLFKLAREHGVEELLPPSIKSTEFKYRRVLERGLQVKGTGEGQRVKGHKWERQKASVVEKRRKAMEEMPELIRLWKQTGHGRGWKKYPR